MIWRTPAVPAYRIVREQELPEQGHSVLQEHALHIFFLPDIIESRK